MAYIRQYRDGWRAEVQRNGQRQSKLFKTKREAQAWALQKEGGAKAVGAGWRTFSQCADKYQLEHPTRSPQWEANTIARLTAHFGADTPIGTITKGMVSDWVTSRLKTVSGSTVVREANLLRNMLRTARHQWEWITHDPFEGFKLPAENAPRHQVWGWKLIKRVLRAPRTGKTAEMQAAFHIALRTAMRLSEVLESPKLLDARRKVVVLASSKTTSGRVEVPIGRIGLRLIARAKFTVGPNEGSVLFGKLCRELLIEDLTFHDARATALTLMSRKVDVLTLARISRHQDLRTLQQVYYRETAEQIAARL
jgi:integrase